ncbi:MAG: Ig-like domain-containing protein [Oligoflexia bacterium]|nr:Ig-like domain-containing protein [Oligoflexia bacterium]
MNTVLVLLTLAACKGNGAGDTAASTCTAPTLTDTWPADGADPVSRSASILVDFDGTLPSDAVTMTVTEDGSAVSGTVDLTDQVLRWTPDAELAAQTAVSWSLDACGATASGSFTTGDQGTLLSADDLQDATFSLDLDNATWVEPAGGDVIFGQLFGGMLLLGVQDVSDDQIDLIGGGAEVLDDGTVQQDPCIPTFDFDASSFANNPYMQVGPTTLELDFQGIAVPITDVTLSGAFLPAGDGITGGAMGAEIDARDVATSVGMSADQLCEFIESYTGVACVACTTDGVENCIGLQIEDIEGNRLASLHVAPNPNPQECTTDTGGGS